MKTKLTKSEQEVIDALNDVKSLPKTWDARLGMMRRMKRHDKAIADLKARGVIEVGEDMLLRVVKPLTTDRLAHGDYVTGLTEEQYEELLTIEEPLSKSGVIISREVGFIMACAVGGPYSPKLV